MDKNLEKEKELYRKERKERISKNAKANEKGSSKGKDHTALLSRVLTWIFCIVLVGAIVVGTAVQFGVPQKVLRAVKIDGKSYSAAEYAFYYASVYNSFANYSKNYGSTYADGFDYNQSAADQTHTDSDGNEETFDKYFAQLAIDNMANVKRYYAKALEENIELTDEDNETINEAMTQFDSARGNYSVSSYLSKAYGRGITERLFKKVVTEQQYVTRFKEIKDEELSDNITDDKINEEYASNKKDYDVVDFRWYTIDIDTDAADTDAAKSDAEAKADEFIAAVKADGNTEDAFKKQAIVFLDSDSEDYETNKETYSKDGATILHKTDYATISSSVSTDAADWIYSVDDNGNYNRASGEMAKYSTDQYVYIIYTLGVPYQDTVKPVSVRHILCAFSDDTSAEPTDEEKQAAKEKAETVLQSYKDSLAESGKEYDEDAFVSLVSSNSDDTGTSSSGGLIEDMINNDQYVAEFEDWAFAEGDFAGESRKTGDVGIIETEYGYHVMYFVGQDDEPSWYTTIKDSLADKESDTYWEEFDAQFSDDDIVSIDWVKNKVVKDQVARYS